MSDYEKKLDELENANADLDIYIGMNDEFIIHHFINDYVFIEYVYTTNGDFIEAHEIDNYPKP